MDFKVHPPEKSQPKVDEKLLKVVAILSFTTIMIYLNIKEFPIFLSIIEVSNVVLAISIAVVVLNTYGLSEGREFPLLGVAYIFISIFLFLHAIILSSQHQLNVTSAEMIIIALYMESGTFLVKGMLLEKKINIYVCSAIYTIVSALLLLEIFKWNFFVNTISSKTGMYYFNKGSLHIIATAFAISAVIFYKKRKCLDKRIFRYIMTALLLKTFAALILSFTIVNESNTFIDSIGYFATIVSFYFLYQGIVIANLKKPYTKINMQNHTLKAVLEATADGILVVNELGKVLRYNENFARMWRIPKEILEKKEDKEFLSFVKDQLLNPDDFIKELEKAVKDPNDETSIISFRDGRVYERFSKPLVINGQINGRVWCFRDITDQVNMIETLKIKENIIETSINAIACTDMEGKTTYANQSFLDLWGYNDFEEVRNKDGTEFMADLDELIEMKSSLENHGTWSGEIKGKRKDQSMIDVECFSHMIYDKAGKYNYAVVFSNDISKRKQAEKKLAQSEALYRRLIEILPDAVFVSKDQKITMTNNEGLKLTQYSSNEEIRNRHHSEVINVHYDHAKAVEERIHKLTVEETTVDFLEQKIIIKNGDIIDVEIGATSFKQENEHYMVMVVRDISERKKVEKLQHQTQIFANISHELKTPLNIILGSIQLLDSLHEGSKECSHYHKCNRYLSIMKQNCFRLLRLINNLIDITRIDSGFLQLKLGSYNIIDIVENITQSVVDYASMKDISLIFDTDIEEKVLVFDPDKMERILLNLLSNAVKFTESGGTIEVNIYEREGGIAISVKDSGIGIPQDKLQEVFQRFRQVGSPLHQKNEGSGIGLSLVEALVEAHEGRISVKSRLGEGTEFSIELPSRSKDKITSRCEEVATASAREINIEKISIEFSDIYSARM